MAEMKVEYMAHSGDDILVLNAARASFGKETGWEYDFEWDDVLGYYAQCSGPKLSDRDTKLLRFLAREKHLLPFRHPQITLRCRAPLFVARQLGKHQTGMSWSEESRRYITTEPEFYWPDKWRKAAENVKQGSSDEELTQLDIPGEVLAVNPTTLMVRAASDAYNAYALALKGGMAPELARMILPQNMMITWVWTGSLLSFFHMYKERSHPTAQKETRDFAEMVQQEMIKLYPNSWEALLAN